VEVYLMAILDNYMFRPVLAIFRLSSRELKVLLYRLCAHVVQRSLHRALLRNVISVCGSMPYWGDLGVDGWIILRWISRRWDVGMWTGLGWPRIETGGGRL